MTYLIREYAVGFLKALGHDANTIRCAESLNTPLWRGALEKASARRCKTCEGRGEICSSEASEIYQDGSYRPSRWRDCPDCRAQGIEAGTAETVEQGSVHESPVGEQPMRPKDTA